MKKGLIKKLNTMGAGAMSDEYLAIAYNIEQALLDAGAEPRKDYNYLDLFTLAQPMLIEFWKNDKITEYSYPALEVLK